MLNIKYKRFSLINLITTVAFVLGIWSLAPSAGFAEKEQKNWFVAQGSTIEATSSQENTLYLNNDRTYQYNLTAQQRATIDGITIPVGATIVGKYVPADGGLRYEAQAVTYDQYSYPISATSQLLRDTKDPRDTSAGAIASDAGIGAAGGVVLGEVLGDEANVEEIIGGAAAGAAVGNVTADRVIVVEPNKTISLFDN